jgi:hypothetical protein
MGEDINILAQIMHTPIFGKFKMKVFLQVGCPKYIAWTVCTLNT